MRGWLGTSFILLERRLIRRLRLLEFNVIKWALGRVKFSLTDLGFSHYIQNRIKPLFLGNAFVRTAYLMTSR